MTSIKVYQWALIILVLFVMFSHLCKIFFSIQYNSIISYYWLCFTILTGLWEILYIVNNKITNYYSHNLLDTNSHIWCKVQDISIILPINTSKIFYGEYGAYADRLYMTRKNKWSIIIEGSHAIFCGCVSLICIIGLITKNMKMFYIALGFSMGSQLMNSVLYISEYIIQTYNSNSVNYDTPCFPCGKFLCKRPFMWINVFWTLMPSYVLIYNFTKINII